MSILPMWGNRLVYNAEGEVSESVRLNKRIRTALRFRLIVYINGSLLCDAWEAYLDAGGENMDTVAHTMLSPSLFLSPPHPLTHTHTRALQLREMEEERLWGVSRCVLVLRV